MTPPLPDRDAHFPKPAPRPRELQDLVHLESRLRVIVDEMAMSPDNLDTIAGDVHKAMVVKAYTLMRGNVEQTYGAQWDGRARQQFYSSYRAAANKWPAYREALAEFSSARERRRSLVGPMVRLERPRNAYITALSSFHGSSARHSTSSAASNFSKSGYCRMISSLSSRTEFNNSSRSRLLARRLNLRDTSCVRATAPATLFAQLIDEAEAAMEGRDRLLTALATTALRAGLGVAAVTRADGARVASQALADAARAAGPAARVGEHTVGRLTAAEIAQVAAAFPVLGRLVGEPRAVWLLGRPGLVDLLLRAGAAGDLPAGPLCEADVFAAVWSRLVRRGEVREPGGPTPDAREQALVALARRRLLPADPGKPPDAGALPALRSDGLLAWSAPQAPGPGATGSPVTWWLTWRSPGFSLPRAGSC